MALFSPISDQRRRSSSPAQGKQRQTSGWRVDDVGGANRPSRQFRLTVGSFELHVMLDESVAITAETLKTTWVAGDISTQFELMASFMMHVLYNHLPPAFSVTSQGGDASPDAFGEDDPDQRSYLTLLRVLLLTWRRRYVTENHILAVTRPHGAHVSTHETRNAVLRLWFDSIRVLRRAGMLFMEEVELPQSALFHNVKENLRQANPMLRLFGVFGGQGLHSSHGTYLDELRETVAIYGSLVIEFISSVSAPLDLHASSAEGVASALYGKWGMNLMQWFRPSSTQSPDEEYLSSAPVSFPLIALIQIAHYVTMLKLANMTPDQGRKLFSRSGLAGHSQGIVSAVVVSSSGDWDGLRANTKAALTLMCWMGMRIQQSFPSFRMNPKVLQDSVAQGEGNPTPMLSINGLPLRMVETYVKESNLHLPAERLLHISLVNGPRAVVVTGHPLSLYGLQVRLRKIRAPSSGSDQQNKVPFSKRLLKFSTRYLNVSSAFHNPLYLSQVPLAVAKDMEGVYFPLRSDQQVPVYSTYDGTDLRNDDGELSLVLQLTQLICTREVHWEKATAVLYSDSPPSHVVEFGPGGKGGICKLIAEGVEGRGVQVILASSLIEEEGGRTGAHSKVILDASFLHDASIGSIRPGENWRLQFAPTLVVTAAGGGQLEVSTRFTRLLGKPHVMVSGMTPTSANAPFCSAILNAGYHVELAGGGLPTEASMRQAVIALTESINPGDCFALNLLYLNQRLWNFQFPLAIKMRREGYPIDGLCIGAGVPTLDRAADIIAQMRQVGMRHLSLKPSSVSTILEVKAIADAQPDFHIILQWTGGRGGGHHSYEDAHAPILRTYGALRSSPNLILVMGSGLGDAQGSLPYLTGSWSHEFEYPSLPFDAVLMGSRMLVATEALGAPETKEAIIACSGCDPHEWERSYEGPVGGVVTVRSEMGEPIHKVATRGVLLWKELDDTIFKVAKDKKELLSLLSSKRDYIIAQLNANYQKVWFPPSSSGSLDAMTYGGVARRCVSLMFVASEKRWVDPSWQNFVFQWLQRIEQRFVVEARESLLTSSSLLAHEPLVFLETVFFSKFPQPDEQLLSTEDVLFFLSLCRAPGQKPVPFIPVLDEHFETYFKKDSLWQSEDLSSVVDRDAGRVCILQGPVAARYSTKIEPCKDILDGIRYAHIDALRALQGDRPISRVAFLSDSSAGGVVVPRPASSGFHMSASQVSNTLSFTIDEEPTPLPQTDEWLSSLAGEAGWSRALLLFPHIVRRHFFLPNAVSRLLAPRRGMVVLASRNVRGELTSLDVYDRAVVSSVAALSLKATLDSSSKTRIDLTLRHHAAGDRIVPLTICFVFNPQTPQAPISELEGRERAVLDFYKNLWLSSEASSAPSELASVFTVARSAVVAFSRAIDQIVEPQTLVAAPLDYAIAAAWKALARALTDVLDGSDPLRLVHLSNEFKTKGNVLREGDVVCSSARVTEVVNTASGKRIQVEALLMSSNDASSKNPLITIVSTFFVVGTYTDTANTFVLREEVPMRLLVRSKKTMDLLLAKPFFQWDQENRDLLRPGVTLTFTLSSETRELSDGGMAKMRNVRGQITTITSANEVKTLGQVAFESVEPSAGEPVTAFLKRHGISVTKERFFEEGYPIGVGDSEHEQLAPSNLRAYSEASGDWNPIHSNSYFASLAGHPGNIVHGMWTSAYARKLVEIFGADNCPSRVVSWRAEFVDAVKPAESLKTDLRHVGMSSGRLLIQAVVRASSDGRTVLKGMAEVEQPPTVYCFTGQGSQTVGMGMDLIKTSAVAREIWERADSHMDRNYGFSILQIVRNNPGSLTVHFGGSRGAEIRDRYRSMHFTRAGQRFPLFPEITDESDSYTFHNSNGGLLNATQFTQPALCLFERAAFADLVEKGMVQEDAPFCGHSLGEYAALASIGDVLPIETLVDVVFYRGLTMALAVPRNPSTGSSDYGMVAINPARVSRSFSQAALEVLLLVISRLEGDALLEIVNFNVENWQYVAAGTLRCLDILQKTLDRVVSERVDLRPLIAAAASSAKEGARFRTQSLPDLADGGASDVEKMMTKFVKECATKCAATGTVITQGHATIPLPGIDVPFHSKMLRPGVAAFREYLITKLRPSFVNVSRLEDKYIPNVVAEPFQLSKTYIENAASVTGSEILQGLLASWKDQEEETRSAEETQLLAHTLLVELLAFQFASPVQWISTQDVLFSRVKVEKLVEIGPAPTLANMATRTLKLKYEVYDEAVTFRRQLLSWAKDRDEIYYAKERIDVAPATAAGSTTGAAGNTAATAAAAVASAPPPPAPITSGGGGGGGIPLTPLDVMSAIAFSKLKQPIDTSKSIKDLSNGRSALQNEIIGDLGKEFPSLEGVSDGLEEKPLKDVAALVSSFSGDSLGKVTATLSQRMLLSSMPAGFDARAFLVQAGALSSAASNKLLVTALMNAPSTRLANEDAAKSYWTQLAAKTGTSLGVSASGSVSSTLPNPVVAGGAGAAQRQPFSMLEDAAPKPEFFLRVLLARKLNVSLGNIASSSSIRELTGGKSAQQNEIMGDVLKEFGDRNVPENGADMKLSALSATLATSYAGFGPWTEGEVARMLRNKVSGVTVSTFRQFLESKGFPKGRQDAVLMLSLAHEPPSRLATTEVGEEWMKKVFLAYAQEERLSLPSGASGAGSGGAAAAVPSADVLAMVLRHDTVWRDQLESVARHLKFDLRSGHKLLQKERESRIAVDAQLDTWKAEHGDFYAEGIVPMFSSLKARIFDSWWNWVHQDALQLCMDILWGRLTAVHREVVATCVPVINRADQNLVAHMQHEMQRCQKTQGRKEYQLVWELGQPLLTACKNGAQEPPVFWNLHMPKAPKTTVDEHGMVQYSEVDRPGVRNLKDFVTEMRNSFQSSGESAFLKLKQQIRNGAAWQYSEVDTKLYMDAMESLSLGAVTFTKKDALVIGAGAGSIGIEIVSSLLCGGARVCVTTSRFSSTAMRAFCEAYQKRGSRNSQLVVVPFNAASRQDIQSLISYIYQDLGWDLDFIVPFAAIDEGGRDLTSIDDRSELAHRMMLTNVERLLGQVVTAKRAHNSTTRPAQVLLPLSPNHGIFGSDGLYGESKVGLEVLLNKWHSERWGDSLSLVGAVIGWTRGTGLMERQNVVAQSFEELGVRTFSTTEMAFALLALFHRSICRKAQKGPLIADLGGNMQAVDALSSRLQSIRAALEETSETRRIITQDALQDRLALTGKVAPARVVVQPRANNTFPYHALPTWAELEGLRKQLQGLVDLDHIVVVTGYGEVGPWGSARTRWEMEASGKISLEGCVELAWVMGFIVQGPAGGGWTDRETGVPVADGDIKSRYESRILQHSGIRFIDPALVGGYDPNNKTFLAAVSVEHDLPPFQVSEEEGQQLVAEHKSHVEVYRDDASGKTLARLLRGAVIYVPKALQFDRLVAGLLPSGWDAKRYGIPEEIINQVDPVSLYSLVSAMEAFVSAGIVDPYELYEYIHVSELGNSMGSGQGGMRAQKRLYVERMLDRNVQSDILQENFINTAPAWVNMLLLSSAGPIKTPVGACATAVESIEIGVETILSGKAKVMLVGGYDDFGEEGSYEFAQMHATSSALEELARGREPREMSRPATSTRSGFMESQGAGAQILMTASLALKLGVPIYGIIAHTSTATDREGRSVPAPGQGILTTARETHHRHHQGGATDPPELSLAYRREQLEREILQLEQWSQASLAKANGDEATIQRVQLEACRRREMSLQSWGTTAFAAGRHDISPLRAALSVFGLTIDDVGVASFHGTGTKGNDINEAKVLYSQLQHLGRATGNAVPAIMQKYLTGHPKGAAAAWMLNGLLQSLLSGIVPGNRNADNIDGEFRDVSSLIYFPSVSLQTDGLKAGLLKSFGFGQVGGEVLVIHPNYVLALLNEEQYSQYCERRQKRQQKTYRHHHSAMAGQSPFVKIQNSAPFENRQMQAVYLDPLARVRPVVAGNAGGKTWEMQMSTPHDAAQKAELMMSQMDASAAHGVGVDIEPIASINMDSQTFLERNFTPAELAACRAKPDPRASLCARWCAKEAVSKAILSGTGVPGAAGSPLRDIEICNDEAGAPFVKLHGNVALFCHQHDIANFRLTISHAGDYGLAFAVALKREGK